MGSNADILSLTQILGNNECFEPYTSNIYVRRVLSGEFTVVNQHLLQDLTRLGLWNRDLKNELVHRDGSVQARSTQCSRAGAAGLHVTTAPVPCSGVVVRGMNHIFVRWQGPGLMV